MAALSNSTEFCTRLKDRIKRSEYWSEKSRENGNYLQNIKCPECGCNEGWTYRESPWVIICNRANECGARTKTLNLFPEFIQRVEKEYPPLKKDPYRPARIYLQSRSLNLSLDGLDFLYKANIRKTGSGGVMFLVGTNAEGKKVYNGRLFNPPVGEGKTHNQGSTAGMCFKHPKINYDPKKPTFATEGIIDANSLIEMGYQAIAVLSSGQDPSKIDLGALRNNLVLAFDSDSAGAGGLKKWKGYYPKAKAITPIKGDWNDLLCSMPLEKAKEYFEEHYKEFEIRAKLLLAKSAPEYASIYQQFYDHAPGLFPFDRSLWFSQITPPKGKSPGGLLTSHVGNFTLKVDHFQLDNTIEDEPTNRYHLKIYPQRNRPIFCSVTGSELSAANSLRSMFLTRARVVWEGDSKASIALAKIIAESGAPVVRQLHIIGHDIRSGFVVLKDFAIDPTGKAIQPDKKGFFGTSRHEYLRAPSQPTLRPKRGIEPAEAYILLNMAWPENGPLTIAFAVASWFVNQVKRETGFFPFLTLHGDTQTGKTRLIRIANAMQCLDEEGLPMTKLNTGKGEIRKLAQRSGLFKALIEGNNAEKIRFDYDSILPLYNAGNHLQVRALKTNGIETHETEFLSSLIFVQNREPFKTKAQMERVISSRPFRPDDLTPATTEAFNRLVKVPLQELAFFFIEVMRHRKAIESEWLKEYEKAREEIIKEVNDNRIAENHGLILAFHRLLCRILKVTHDLKPFLVKLACKKQEQCSKLLTTQADHFFSAIDKLEDHVSSEVIGTFLVIRKDLGELRVQVPEALRQLKMNSYDVGNLNLLYDSLRDHPAYKSNGAVNEEFNIERAVHLNGDPQKIYEPEKKKWRVWTFDLARLGKEA